MSLECWWLLSYGYNLLIWLKSSVSHYCFWYYSHIVLKIKHSVKTKVPFEQNPLTQNIWRLSNTSQPQQQPNSNKSQHLMHQTRENIHFSSLSSVSSKLVLAEKVVSAATKVTERGLQMLFLKWGSFTLRRHRNDNAWSTSICSIR